MTGITAEKHDAFLSPDSEGKAILDFSGKSLLRVNRTLRLFLPAEFAPLSKHAAIRHGTARLLRSSAKTPQA
jgi:hypothetical protein